MGLLATIERTLERLFERQTARLFRAAIRPVQVQRRLERQMENTRTRDGARTIVPHVFLVRLQPDELAALLEGSPDLASSLADGALAFARRHGYTLLDRPIVTLRPDPAMETGDFTVSAIDPVPAARVDRVDLGDHEDDGSVDRRARAGVEGTVDDADAAPSMPVGERTAVFVVPGAEGPRATIREVRPDLSSRTMEFDGRPITIGRAPDNGLVLRDGRASRHHARIDGRRGSLVLTDLGSTNGSFVNDRRVDSVALGEGDRIRIGTTSLIVEAVRSDTPDEWSGARSGVQADGEGR
jgi:Protein of unknown function (DUF3662)/FHA domain